MDDERETIIEKLFDERRIFFHPEALSKSDSDTKKYFGNNIEKAKNSLKEAMWSFPSRLLEVISESERGNVMIISPSSMPGFISGQYDPKTNRAYVTTRALMENNGVAQEEIIHLLDHLLGSDGKGPRLSDGYGRSEKLQLFAQEINELYQDKENKISEYGDSTPHEFLAQSVRFYLTTDPEILRKIIPKVYNMIEAQWFNNEFWKEILK